MKIWSRGLGAGVITAVALTSLVGCGSGGKGKVSTRSGTYVGKLTSVVNWKIPEETFAGLSPARRAALQQKGITIDDTAQAIQSPELPLAGHWVKVGDRYCMTDSQGIFKVEGAVPTGGSAPVYSQVGNTSAEGEVPMASLVPEGQTPSTVRLLFNYDRPVTASVGRAAAPDGCPVKGACQPGAPNGNKAACCLDYNGEDGDGLPRLRVSSAGKECRSKATDNYFMSTCFLWTFTKGSRPCLNEEDYDGNRDESCWKTHRYRNCQNMVEDDLNAPAKVVVPLGGRVTIPIRNNTTANATVMFWQEAGVPGKIEKEPGAPSVNGKLEVLNNGIVTQNYSESLQEHYEDFVLAYVAPESLPDNKKTAVYHLISSAGGVVKVTEVVVGDGKYIELNPASDSIEVGQQTDFVATAYDGEGNVIDLDFEWSVSNSVASVTSQGLATALNEGQCIITVRSPGTDLRATATLTVEKKPKPGGFYGLSAVNGDSPPKVVNEYYDKQLKYTFRMTIYGGSFEINDDGTFAVERKGGEAGFPVTSKGSGTYQVIGDKIKFTYTSGYGPGEATVVSKGKIAVSYVFPQDKQHFPKEVPVTEVYTLK